MLFNPFLSWIRPPFLDAFRSHTPGKGKLISKLFPTVDAMGFTISQRCELPRPKGRGFPLHRQYLHHGYVM